MKFRLRPRGTSAPTRSTGGVEIVPMRRRDVPDVIAIERRVFTMPWSENLYLSELSMPSTRLYYVARADGAVVGYVGCMLIAGEGHITTIGVAPEFQRRRVGKALLHRVAIEARERAIEALTLEVRVSNRGAQELYRTFGFAPVGVRKNYYADDNEDAIVMWAHGLLTREYTVRLESIGSDLAEPASSRSTTDGSQSMPGTGPVAGPGS